MSEFDERGREPFESIADDTDSAEGIVPIEQIIDTELKELPEEVKKAVTNRGLEILRSALHGLDGYIVFASTAKYLHGVSKGIEELQKAPGDFDLAVFDDETLDRIRDRFMNETNVEFLNVEPTESEKAEKKLYLSKDDVQSGRAVTAKAFPGESSRVLKGRLLIKMDTALGEGPNQRTFSIPFEIFSRTNVIEPQLKRYEETVGGLRTLSLEGLEKQYTRSLEKESRVAKNREEVRAFLENDEIRDVFNKQNIEELQPYLDRLDLTLDQLKNYYELSDSLKTDKTLSTQDRTDKEEAISKLLSGFKTKIESRKESVRTLKEAQAPETQS